MNNKQIERLYNMVLHLANGGAANFKMERKDGSILEVNPKQLQAFTAKKMQEFVHSPFSSFEKDGRRLGVQAFTGSSDIEKVLTNTWNAIQESDNFDTFWQLAFRTVPLSKGQLEWTIGTVSSGVTFKLLAEGQKVEYAKITGTTVKGEVELYGSGLEITWKCLEGRDLAGFYNSMLDFRNRRQSEYADIFYGLLYAACAVHPVDYQLTSAASTLDRDIATLNEAYNTIGAACKDKGMGDTANVKMLAYAGPRLRGRINQALRVTGSDMARAGGKGQIFDGNIDPYYSFTSHIPANKALIGIPGFKTQNSVYLQDKAFERISPENLSWLKTSFTAFGGVIGDTNQWALVDFAD